MATPSAPRRPSAGDYAAVLAASSLLATTYLTAPSEGFKPRPYWDPAHIRTYCMGETQHVEERTYSYAECRTLLDRRVQRDYAPKLAACVPEAATEERLRIFAALEDAAYNAGTAAVCNSPMVKQIHAGDVGGAIAAFTAKGAVGPLVTHGWFTTARYRGPAKPAAVMRRAGWTWAANAWRKELPGLVCRRKKEAAIAAGFELKGIC